MPKQLSLFEELFPREKAQEIATPAPVTKRESRGVEKTINQVPGAEKKYSEALFALMPERGLPGIVRLLAHYNVKLILTPRRYSKLGDYRSPRINRLGKRTGEHRITVNKSLNRFSFLITLVHELAHLLTWEKSKRKTIPHGKEWKKEFRGLLLPLVQSGVFPGEIKASLLTYLQNPSASSCTDITLVKVLRNYDEKDGETVHLEDLPEHALFSVAGSHRVFIKGKKLRKRFLCADTGSKRKYLVSPVAEVRLKDP